MQLRGRRTVPILVAAAALFITAMPAVASPTPRAGQGIDDPGGNDAAPGVNIIREVDSTNSVIVRLTEDYRQAHFNVIVRGVPVRSVEFETGGDGVDGAHDDRIWGDCLDEVRLGFGRRGGKRGVVAKAKFYTCGFHDTIVLKLGRPKLGRGSFPAIKIVFTQGVKENVDGVYVGEDPTNVGNGWIPLFD